MTKNTLDHLFPSLTETKMGREIKEVIDESRTKDKDKEREMSEEKYNIEEIVMKFVGPIDPVGETNTDNKRYENLKSLMELVESLIVNLNDVKWSNHASQEYSCKRVADTIDKFFKDTGIEQ